MLSLMLLSLLLSLKIKAQSLSCFTEPDMIVLNGNTSFYGTDACGRLIFADPKMPAAVSQSPLKTVTDRLYQQIFFGKNTYADLITYTYMFINSKVLEVNDPYIFLGNDTAAIQTERNVRVFEILSIFARLKQEKNCAKFPWLARQILYLSRPINVEGNTGTFFRYQSEAYILINAAKLFFDRSQFSKTKCFQEIQAAIFSLNDFYQGYMPFSVYATQIGMPDLTSWKKRQLGATGGDGIFKANCDLLLYGTNKTSELLSGCALGAAYACSKVSHLDSCAKYWANVYTPTIFKDIHDNCAQYGPNYNSDTCLKVSAKHCLMVGSTVSELYAQMMNCEQKRDVLYQRTSNVSISNACAVACTSYKIIFKDKLPYGLPTSKK